MSSVRSPFGAFATTVVVWEVAAVASENLHRANRLKRRVPFICEVVRKLPTAGRILFVGGVAIVLWEHLEHMALCRYLRQLVRRWTAPAQ